MMTMRKANQTRALLKSYLIQELGRELENKERVGSPKGRV